MVEKHIKVYERPFNIIEIAVIGLGYVGLPLANLLSENIQLLPLIVIKSVLQS